MTPLDTIVRRIGTEHRDDVRCVTVRLTDAQLEEIAADRRVVTMAHLRRRIEQLPRRRRPSSPPERAFFQREVRGLETYTEQETGERLVSAWNLSCGHTIPTHKRVPATTRTKTMPCPVCGSGTRTPYDRRREEERAEIAFSAAYGTDGARETFSALVRCAALMVTLPPLDRRMAEVRAEVTEHLSRLGVTHSDTRTEAYA